MGVLHLWDLLAPTGSRLDINALAGKRVAVDASIWLVQFLKAMRDERGEVVPNAHLLGFFRRIVRLLCNRIRPVFVFDGETPAMKRQTVAARRRQRAQADVKLKRVAEKLLLSHVKQHLAANKGGPRPPPGAGPGPSTAGGGDVLTEADVADELEPTVRVAAYDDHIIGTEDDPDAEPEEEEEEEWEDGLDMGLLELPMLADGETYDVAALAALPASLQLQLIHRMRDQRSAANREKLQAASARAPSAFSTAQLEAYIANGKVKRQLDELIRTQPGPGLVATGQQAGGPGGGYGDSMRSQRIASDAASEFVFTETGRGGQQDPLDDMLPYGRKKGVRPVTMPTSKPRLYLGNAPLHSILPPPLPGTMPGLMAPPVQSHAHVRPADTAAVQPSPAPVKDAELPGGETAGFAITFEVPDTCDVSDDEWEDVEDAVPAEDAEAPPAAASSPPPRAGVPAPSAADIISLLSDEDDHPPGAPASADAAPGKLSRRQLYARSHGFLMGRSLDDWADEGEAAPLLNAGKPQEPVVHSAAEDEDMDIAVAIARSLQDTPAQAASGAPTSGCGAAAALATHGGDADLAAALALSMQPASAPATARPGAHTGGDDGEVTVVGVSDAPGDVGGGDSECPSFLVTTHDGTTLPLTWPAFSAVVDDISSSWPPWLPGPLELDNEPVGVTHVGTGAEWLITTPVLSSLTRIRREAHQVEAQHAAGGGVQRQNAPAKTSAMLPPRAAAPPAPPVTAAKQGKPRVAFTSPDEMLVNGPAVAWDDAWEGAAAEYKPPAQAGGGFTAPDAAAAAEAARLDDEFEAERAVLRAEQRAASKAADAVSPEMYVEVQELLTLFGIPYIIAPFEAEAQCAWLEQAGLVDAVVTDDSDALLFGAKTVCRNIFEARKFVELYTADAITERLGLNREHLTLMALLLGSDYTPGVTGVGIVHAAEILSAFPGMDGLRRFKAWVDAPESDLVAEELRGGLAGKKGGGKHKGKAAASDDEQPEVIVVTGGNAPAPEEEDSPAAVEFKRRHAGARKTFVLGDSFPNQAVVDAYLKPNVDTSRERFEWGAPDELLLRHFCATRLGWPPDKVDPILYDVLRQHAVRETQRTVTSFFRPQDGEAFAKVRSKRLVKAIAQLTGKEDPTLALGDQDDAVPKPLRQKRPKAPRKRQQQQEGAPEAGEGGAGPVNAPNKRRRQPGQRIAEDGFTIVEPSGLGFDVAALGSEF